MLELAQYLGSVSTACRTMDYSRQQFYQIRRNYQTFGSEDFLDRMPGASAPYPNRVSDDLEKAILDRATVHPSHGCLGVSQEPSLQGITVSSTGVRRVWVCHDLMTKHDRLLRSERSVREQTIELTDEQIRLLERFNHEFRERDLLFVNNST